MNRVFKVIKSRVRKALSKSKELKSNFLTALTFRNRMTSLDLNEFQGLGDKIDEFIRRMNVGHCQYKFSKSAEGPSLYASAYACMTLSLLGRVDELSREERLSWANYFDEHQDPESGLFYEKFIDKEVFYQTDWWGARHLALHMISAYTDLGFKPKFEFEFLRNYYNFDAIDNLVSELDVTAHELMHSDIDNKIMNIGCLLQYQRDAFQDDAAGRSLQYLKIQLKNRLDEGTGFWGSFNPSNPEQRSRAVQFFYHLLQIFTYDGDYSLITKEIISLTLRTQNRLGGFGVKWNSSACEDIDSIDILVRSRLASGFSHSKNQKRLTAGLNWVLCNQVGDNGFVFRLHETFFYGSEYTSSMLNEGNLMATWFRLLSIVYLCEYLGLETSFKITNCPGYEFN